MKPHPKSEGISPVNEATPPIEIRLTPRPTQTFPYKTEFLINGEPWGSAEFKGDYSYFVLMDPHGNSVVEVRYIQESGLLGKGYYLAKHHATGLEATLRNKSFTNLWTLAVPDQDAIVMSAIYDSSISLGDGTDIKVMIVDQGWFKSADMVAVMPRPPSESTQGFFMSTMYMVYVHRFWMSAS